MDYDARGRMASVVDGDHDRQTTFYGLNGLGQRIVKRGAGVQIGSQNEYVFDEVGHLLGEYDARGNVIEENVWLGDIPVAVMTTGDGDHDRDDKNGVFYIAADNLGAPHVITDNKGKRVWEWQHDPFGNDKTQLHQVRSDFLTFDLRFPGQIADAESGLNYNMARDYAPSLGRYIESDPVGLDAGTNTYGYVAQTPISASDPKGLYGTQSCSFWQQACEVGGNNSFYACQEAQLVCSQFPTFFGPTVNKWAECTRQCLQDKYASELPSPSQCGPGNNVPSGTIAADHAACWSACMSSPDNPIDTNPKMSLPNGDPSLFK